MFNHRIKIKRRWEQVSEEDEGGGTNSSQAAAIRTTIPRIHPRSSSTNPGIQNQQLIKQATLEAVTAQAVALQQQQLCNLGPKIAPIIADGGGSILNQPSVVTSVAAGSPMNNSTIIPNSHMTQQIAANPAAAMSSYAANNIPLLPNHQTPQQSFIPGHLPQHVAPHPQHQAAFAATALNQQQAGAPSSFVNFSTILNQKDSRWLQLEVCREFQRNKCSRPDVECKFAHPGSAIEIQSGKVTACYDSIKVNKYYFLSVV